jgi:DNA-binding response OmpR family regulator
MTAAWVLVVAGDATERMSLFRALESCGYNATAVADADAALELLRDEPYDAVLVTDAADMNGCQLPVIVASEHSVVGGGASGYYLSKPIKPAVLRSTLANALNKQGSTGPSPSGSPA